MPKIIDQSTDQSLVAKLKAAYVALKGAGGDGELSKPEAAKVFSTYFGPKKTKKLLKHVGHTDDETIKLLESDERTFPSFQKGARMAENTALAPKLKSLKEAAVRFQIVHAKLALEYRRKVNQLVAEGYEGTSMTDHYERKALTHTKLSDDFGAFAKGVHVTQKLKAATESLLENRTHIYHLVNSKTGEVVKTATGIRGKQGIKAPSSLQKLQDTLSSDHEIVHDEIYSQNVKDGRHKDLRQK
jgi:hypothetical protein